MCTKKTLLVVLIIHVIINSITAKKVELGDSVKTKKVNYLVIPILFRSIETKWAIGASGSLSFKTSPKNDSLTRTSTIQGIVMFTERHQSIQALDASIFFPKENYIFYLQSSHSYFPDKFWGLGSNTAHIKHEDYNFSQVYLFTQLKKKLIKNVFAGLIYEFQNVYSINHYKNKLFDTTMICGKEKHIVSGLGASICFDNRNSSYWPTKGALIQISYRAAVKSFLNSNYTNLKTIIDVRYFKKVHKTSVFALQLYALLNFSESPIRELAMLGGANNLRGFYQGRYRDDKMTSFIGEYRIPIYKRFGVCVFGGLGCVYKAAKDITANSIKSSYGAGIRLSILPKEKLNIRVDYGFADIRNRGLYFTIGECF
jgi:outer membrane protein assembly factor BamA